MREAPPLLWAALLLMRRAPAPPPACGRCGCPVDAHVHYRPGSDCGRCGAVCPRYAGRVATAAILGRELARLVLGR